jgi:molecular chaperone GrpE
LSKKARNPSDPVGDASGGSEGADAPSLAMNPELEAALRDAVDSVEAGNAAVEKNLETDEFEVDIDSDINSDINSDMNADTKPNGERALDQKSPKEIRLTEATGEFIDEEVERLREELIGSQDRHMRLQADFENFRKRALKERTELIQYGHENLVKDLLSTVDNLDRAIEHTQQSDGGDLESLLQGVELLQRELHAILERHAVSEISAMGGAFDPALHEAMAQVPDGSVAPNTVIDVLQKGYQLHGRLLRPSRVVVAREPEKSEVDGGETG